MMSAIPGFRRWLEAVRLSAEHRALLARLEGAAWHLGEVPETLQKLLSRLCAHYLLNAKHGPEPLDAVARFHLGNGAALERLNWMGDSSEQGMSRAAGLMVNYVYWLAELERNHERYFREHFITASPLIERLAREAPVLPAVGKGAALTRAGCRETSCISLGCCARRACAPGPTSGGAAARRPRAP